MAVQLEHTMTDETAATARIISVMFVQLLNKLGEKGVLSLEDVTDISAQSFTILQDPEAAAKTMEVLRGALKPDGTIG